MSGLNELFGQTGYKIPANLIYYGLMLCMYNLDTFFSMVIFLHTRTRQWSAKTAADFAYAVAFLLISTLF